MLRDAKADAFQVLVIDDLSRLARDQLESEKTIRRLEVQGLRIIAVSDGYDSNAKAATRKVVRGVKGMMNELRLDELREQVHRGLTGQALKRYWAGGRPYGYRLVQNKDATRLDAHGNPAAIGTRLEVDPATALIVREIFERYGNEWSHRAIADELNRRQVPSPGMAWRHKRVRKATRWMGSAVQTILENSLYRGEYVWNRTSKTRDPDTGKRRIRPRPSSEWIRSTMPELRIVDDLTWQRVQARKARSAALGAAVAQGIKRAGGRPRAQVPFFIIAGVRGLR